MIKKFLTGLSLVVVLALLTVGATIFSRWERPADVPAPVVSRVAHEHYALAGEQAENWLRELYSSQALPSLSAAVGVDGNLVWSGAIGFADIASSTPATEDTRYRIGSISKSLTAVALMRLAEEGKISLHQPLGSFVEEIEPEWQKLTAYQLATHMAGIRHYPDGIGYFTENFSTKHYPSTRAALAAIGDAPPLFAPGGGFHYSTYGYTLLAFAMEQATGVPYRVLMEQVLLKPARMNATGLDAGQPRAPFRATPYLLVEGENFRAPPVDLSYKYAGGGYLSTPEDIVEFGNLLMGSELLSTESRDRFWTPARLSDGSVNSESYAMGFRVWDTAMGKTIHHGGMSVGGYSYLALYPAKGVVVAFMTNAVPISGGFSRHSSAEVLAEIFIDARVHQ